MINTPTSSSYSHRVSKGDTVILDTDVTGCTWQKDTNGNTVWEVADRPVAPAGSIVTVTDETNAGFRGIEFSFTFNGCKDFKGVSTGCIR
jgi:hypothetical protein